MNLKSGDETFISRPGSRTPRVSCRSELKQQLELEWTERHCLRVLPGAGEFANSTSSLFGALKESFDFQVDSVRNQYEHLLSLWRSQCAMVADRAMGEGSSVNEGIMLQEALDDGRVEFHSASSGPACSSACLLLFCLPCKGCGRTLLRNDGWVPALAGKAG